MYLKKTFSNLVEIHWNKNVLVVDKKFQRKTGQK